ncbi:Uncharacterised protein [Mycobacteroides abscessus subsp. abscessus]|nr:Uncharacterised protein [Mycobacteroides abscessus subsp. abscessus]
MTEPVDGAPYGNARDVEQDIHARVRREDVRGEGGHRLVIGDVERSVGADLPSGRLDLLDNRLEPVGRSIGQKQLGTLAPQPQRGGPSDTARGSRDKAALTGEFVRHY